MKPQGNFRVVCFVDNLTTGAGPQLKSVVVRACDIGLAGSFGAVKVGGVAIAARLTEEEISDQVEVQPCPEFAMACIWEVLVVKPNNNLQILEWVQAETLRKAAGVARWPSRAVAVRMKESPIPKIEIINPDGTKLTFARKQGAA